jgi:hypothetical protein
MDINIVNELKAQGYTPFSQSGGVFTFAISDSLLALLSSKFDKSKYIISNKLTFC